MEGYGLEWLELVGRWLHLLFGIAWIGASLHFVRVDRGLVAPSSESDERQGTFWAIHGGGIYEFTKYKGAPAVWPSELHWSKWEAYSTWLSGVLLLFLVYYVKAEAYLYGELELLHTPLRAVMASMALIAGSVLVYEGLIRSALPARPAVLAWVMGGLVLGLSFLSLTLFAPRAAFIHVGAVLGSIMVGNVFFGIIPAQKAFVAAVQQGRAPDQSRADKAKQRSFFNNYFTLPVLFCMVSLHFPMVYQHELAGVSLFLIMLAGALGRHFFNLRHVGLHQPIYLAAAALILMGVAWLIQPRSIEVEADTQLSADPVEARQAKAELEAEVMALVNLHCVNCHADQPTYPGFSSAPAGLSYESLAMLRAQSARAMTAIQSGYMPLGNLTQLSKDDRAKLVRYLATEGSAP